MRVRVVSRPLAAAGFALAGFEVIRAADAEAAGDAVTRLAADPDTGVVLVDDELFRVLPRELISRLERQALPLIAPVPAPRWDDRRTADSYILDILRQAIGYQVRPR